MWSWDISIDLNDIILWYIYKILQICGHIWLHTSTVFMPIDGKQGPCVLLYSMVFRSRRTETLSEMATLILQHIYVTKFEAKFEWRQMKENHNKNVIQIKKHPFSGDEVDNWPCEMSAHSVFLAFTKHMFVCHLFSLCWFLGSHFSCNSHCVKAMIQNLSPGWSTVKSYVGVDENGKAKMGSIVAWIWSNYSDLTRVPHPKWWFSKGNPLISVKSRLVKYCNLTRWICLFLN